MTARRRTNARTYAVKTGQKDAYFDLSVAEEAGPFARTAGKGERGAKAITHLPTGAVLFRGQTAAVAKFALSGVRAYLRAISPAQTKILTHNFSEGSVRVSPDQRAALQAVFEVADYGARHKGHLDPRFIPDKPKPKPKAVSKPKPKPKAVSKPKAGGLPPNVKSKRLPVKSSTPHSGPVKHPVTIKFFEENGPFARAQVGVSGQGRDIVHLPTLATFYKLYDVANAKDALSAVGEAYANLPPAKQKLVRMGWIPGTQELRPKQLDTLKSLSYVAKEADRPLAHRHFAQFGLRGEHDLRKIAAEKKVLKAATTEAKKRADGRIFSIRGGRGQPIELEVMAQKGSFASTRIISEADPYGRTLTHLPTGSRMEQGTGKEVTVMLEAVDGLYRQLPASLQAVVDDGWSRDTDYMVKGLTRDQELVMRKMALLARHTRTLPKGDKRVGAKVTAALEELLLDREKKIKSEKRSLRALRSMD